MKTLIRIVIAVAALGAGLGVADILVSNSGAKPPVAAGKQSVPPARSAAPQQVASPTTEATPSAPSPVLSTPSNLPTSKPMTSPSLASSKPTVSTAPTKPAAAPVTHSNSGVYTLPPPCVDTGSCTGPGGPTTPTTQPYTLGAPCADTGSCNPDPGPTVIPSGTPNCSGTTGPGACKQP